MISQSCNDVFLWQEKLINFRLKRTSTKASRPSEAKGGDRGKSKGETSKPSKRKPTLPAPVTGGAPADSKAKKSPGHAKGSGSGSGSGLGLSEELRSVQQDLQFSNMVLPPPVSQSAPTAVSGSAGNKTQRLQRLLAETEKKRKRLQELSKAETPQDSKQLKNILWNDAIKAAAGKRAMFVCSYVCE